MNPPRLDWNPHRLQDQLQAISPGWRVQAVAHTGSTNADLLEAARQGDLQPRVLVAEAQSAGRGRQGRQWHSAPGASLTFSMAMCLRPLHGWGALSLVVGHALAECLQPWPDGRAPAGQGPLMLKWPNDLWWYATPPVTPADRAQGRKAAGVLIETLPLPAGTAAEGTRWVVIGVGLNIEPLALPAPGNGSDWPRLACVSDWHPGATATDCWHRVVPAVIEAVLEFQDRGAAHRVATLQARDLLVGQPVALTAGAVSQGQCVGIDADGALRVQAEGRVHRVVAGEVSVRPQAGPSPGLPSPKPA